MPPSFGDRSLNGKPSRTACERYLLAIRLPGLRAGGSAARMQEGELHMEDDLLETSPATHPCTHSVVTLLDAQLTTKAAV
jgi:hypothetical protein